MTTELVTTEPPANLAVMRPDAALGINEILAQVALIQTVMAKVMHEGEHYGTIPGCGDKKTLLQPGAQKLCMTFRLAPEYALQETTLAGGHKEYRVICRLSSIASGTFVGSGVGVCSTMEGKYRFRGGARKCPTCGKETIIKGRAEYGGGWLCFVKKGGCGAKWADGADVIEGQSIEKLEHDNPADHFNTVLKMAKKRAFVDATITATAASDIFTQDIGGPEEEDDKPPRHDAPPAAPAPATRAASPTAAPTPVQTLQSLLEASANKMARQLEPVKAAALTYFMVPADTDINDLPFVVLFPSVDMNESAAANRARIKADFDRHLAAIQALMDGDNQIPGAEVPTEGQGSPASAPAQKYHDRVTPEGHPDEMPPGLPPGYQSKRITVKAKSAKSGVKKNGQSYTRYGICSEADEWFNTFSESIAAQAVEGQTVTVWFTISTYGKELCALTRW